MGQQEYDAFKQRLREWMDTHSEEYSAFETMMNRMDGVGFQKIMELASSLAPGYEAVIDNKINEVSFNDISDLQNLLAGNDIGTKLLERLDAPDTDPMLPAMLCWLHFGRSFENMIELGEELMAGMGISRQQQINIAHTEKAIVAGSLDLDLRTRQDWGDYSNVKKAIDNGQVIDWALKSESDEKGKPGRKSTGQTLPEMLTMNSLDKEDVLEKIGQYLSTKHSEMDLARLKIALEELYFFARPVEVKPFRDALVLQYENTVKIVHERGIQKAVKFLNDYAPGKCIFVKDTGEDRKAINKLKKFLSA